MKIGIGLPNQVQNVRASVIPAWAAQAEQAGFAALGTIGRVAYPGVMDTVALAAAAGATTTIGLTSGVVLGPVWPATLLAKEVASIDGVSGGRLTLGISVGAREDDFVAADVSPRARGKRFDQDLETYRKVWQGEAVGGGGSAAVPSGTRQVPMLFGAATPTAMARMARWGEGYIGPSIPAPIAGSLFGMAGKAWQDAGREGSPRLVASIYYSLADPEQGRSNVYDYYSAQPQIQGMITDGIATTPDRIRQAVREYEELGVDEVMLDPGTDDLDEIARLAEILL